MRPLPEHLQPLLEECRPLYALLRRHALRPLGSAVPRPLGSAEDAEQQVQQQAQQGQQQTQQGQQADGGSSGGGGGGQNTAQPQAMQCGSLAYLEDPRNEDVLVGMRDGVTGERHVMLCICEPAVLAACHMWDGGTGVWCRRGSWAAGGSELCPCEPAVRAACQTLLYTGMPAPASMPAPAQLALLLTLPPPGRFELVWRPEAKVSVFDSGFMLGDGVWEGIRLHRGVLLFLQVCCCCCRTVAAFDSFRRPSCH